MNQTLVLSVRPQQFPDVDIDARGRLVVSVMAGVTAETIARRTGADQVVRSMPNAAAAIGRSFTPWFANPAVTAENKRLVQTLFDACGEGAEVPREDDIEYCTGVTGTGAAFPALLAQAMIAHAVARGMSPEFARRAARGVVASASQLLDSPGADPDEIVQTMLDYVGITATALRTMRQHGFADSVAAGLDAAVAHAAAMLGEPETNSREGQKP